MIQIGKQQKRGGESESIREGREIRGERKSRTEGVRDKGREGAEQRGERPMELETRRGRDKGESGSRLE